MADGTIKKFEKDIPAGWTVVYFPDICTLENGSIKRGPFGSSITKSMFVPKGKNTYKVYEQGNAIRKTTEYGDYWLSEKVYLTLKNFAVKPKDIIVSCSGTIGEMFQIPEGAPEGVINQALLKLTLNSNIIDFDYFKIMFTNLINLLKENSIGSAIKNLASIKFLKYEIPILLPPLTEQKRIVAKIEELLSKVQEYAESYSKIQELDKYFPDKLKKSILQYAMQGKLVAQDPYDEPVEVLLEKIKAEKQKLFEEGKIKKKDLATVAVATGDDNSPYGKIPKNWSLLPVKNIFSITTGLSYKKTDLSLNQTGVRIIRGGNIEPFAYKLLDNDYYINKKYITTETVYLKRNQLVTPVSTSLEHIGKFARIDKDYHNVVAGGFIFQLTPLISSDVSSNYLLICLSSPFFYKQLKSITKLSGHALFNIPKAKLNNLLIPIAPYQEQERINAKVEQLFQKVNQF